MTKCDNCNEEYETLSAMVSDDERHYIKSVKCTVCGHTTTLKIPRAAPYRQIAAIV